MAPRIYSSQLEHEELFSDQLDSLAVLEHHIDYQLEIKDSPEKKYVIVILTCEVPDLEVLVELCIKYKTRGWQRVTFSPQTHAFYEEKKYWVLKLIKPPITTRCVKSFSFSWTQK